MHPSRGRGWLLLALALQIAAKLWLVHRHEIAACPYPFDDPWYVEASMNWYWQGSFNLDGFTRPPAYPLWIALSRSLGLPLRLSIELLLCTAAALFVLALVRAGLPRVAAVLVFGLVIFQPFSILVNDYAMADSLYGPILLLAIAAVISLVGRKRSVGFAALAGLALAVLWHTRQESPLLLFYVAVFAAMATWLRATDEKPLRVRVREAGLLAMVMATVMGGITLTVRTMNYASFGVFADHELRMSGLLEAYGALLRIVPERPLRWVPVPQESLRHAYEVSPALRELRPYFDGPEGRNWTAAFLENAEAEPQIGGNFPVALRAAARWSGHGASASDADAFYKRIAVEIDAACRTGQLRCDGALTGPIRLASEGASELPGSFMKVSRLLFWRGDALPERCVNSIADSITTDIFDAAAIRRSSLVADVLHIAGWAVNFDDPPLAASFHDRKGRVVAVDDQFRSRPDIDSAFRSQLETPFDTLPAAFELRIPLQRRSEAGGTLIFTLTSGRTVEVDYSELLADGLRQPVGPGPDHSLQYAIEFRRLISVAQPRESSINEQALSFLFRIYGQIVAALTLAGLGSALIMAVWRNPVRPPRVLLGIAGILLAVVFARIALFALYDAVVWPGDDARFIYPVAALYPAGLVVLGYCAIRQISGPRNAHER